MQTNENFFRNMKRRINQIHVLLKILFNKVIKNLTQGLSDSRSRNPRLPLVDEYR